MNFTLTEDQIAFRDLATQFSRQELLPHAADWDRESTFPIETLRRAGELGFLSLYAPESMGGWAYHGWTRAWFSNSLPWDVPQLQLI